MIDSLISNPENAMDLFCNLCIRFLSSASRYLGISYGELNVFLFVILLPALVLYYFVLSLVGVRKRKYRIIFVILPMLLWVVFALWLLLVVPL